MGDSESTSRRSLLKAAVAVAASTAAVPALADVAPDPIYAAIERATATEKVFAELARKSASDDLIGEACAVADDARWDLACTVSTTPAGLAALTAFIFEQEKIEGHYFHDEDEARAYAESLHLAVTGMAGLKPWEGIETPQAAEPDRIYRLIEEHRRLYKACCDALEAADFPDDRSPKWRSLDEAARDACRAICEAEQALVEIGATTPEGWAALLRYEDEHRRCFEEFAYLSTGETWRMGLLRRMAASLDGKPAWTPILHKAYPHYSSVLMEDDT